MRSHKIILTFILLLIGLGFSQTRKVETDTLKARYAFKIRLSGTWYDRTTFFGFLNGSNQVGLSGIANNAINSAKIVDASIVNADILDPSISITAGDGLYGAPGSIDLGETMLLQVNVDDSTITVVNDTLHVIGGGSATIILNSDSTIINDNGLKVNYDATYFYAAPGASPIFDHWYSKNGGVFRDIENHSWAQGIINDTIYYPMPASTANGRFDAWGNSGGETLYVFNKAGDFQSFILTTDSTRYTIASITFAANDSIYLRTTGTILIDNIYLTTDNGLTLRDSSITGLKIAAGTLGYEHVDQALKNSIDAWKTNVDDTTALKQFTGERIYMDRLASGKLGGGWFTKSDSLYPEGVIAFDCPFPGSQLVRDDFTNGHEIYAEWAGAIGGDGNDDTAPLWKCLSLIESTHANTLILPEDTVYISIANSENTYSCLVIPSNCTFKGRGIDKTIISRVPGERNTNGLLIVTQNWQTASGYDGAQNIIFEGFTITDGDSTPTSPGSSPGDLIALGHCKDIVIRNVKSLNHDQHFVDICAAKNVTIYDCISENRVTNTSNNSIYQIDSADDATSIWQIKVDSTACDNIKIFRNTINRHKSAYGIHMHRAVYNPHKNIQIKDNYIHDESGTGTAAIYKDSNTEVKGLFIEGNDIILNNTSGNSRGIYLLSDSTIAAGNFNDVQIIDNKITGVATFGILAGGGTMSNRFQHVSGINIRNNFLDLNFKGSSAAVTFTGLQTSGIEEAYIADNIFKFTPDAPNGVEEYAIYILNTGNSVIKNNEIYLNERSDSTKFYGILENMSGAKTKSLICTTAVIGNQLFGDGYRFGITFSSSGSPTRTDWIGRVSQNFIYTTDIVTAHYNEQVTMMDGTNNLHFIEWPEANRAGTGSDSIYFCYITDSLVINDIPLKYVKSGNSAEESGWSYQIFYYSPSSPFSREGEIYNGMQLYDSVSVIGIQMADFRLDATPQPDVNNFDLVTGNKGINLTISPVSYQPIIRTDGYIKMRVGL